MSLYAEYHVDVHDDDPVDDDLDTWPVFRRDHDPRICNAQHVWNISRLHFILKSMLSKCTIV